MVGGSWGSGGGVILLGLDGYGFVVVWVGLIYGGGDRGGRRW